jgi:hypothetical protein
VGIDRVDDVRAVPLTSDGVTSLDRGMQTTEYYAAQGRKRDGLLLGGTQDRGILQGRVGSQRTESRPSGDGFCALIDPVDGRYLYGCSQSLDILRYEPTQAHVSYDLPDRRWGRANANAPVLLDPNEPDRMLAGGASLWRSENVRTTTGVVGDRAVWEEIKPALPSAGPGDDRGYVSAVEVTPGDPDAIWVAHNDGQLHRTRNGLAKAPRWEIVDDNASRNPLPDRWISRVRVDALDRNRVFVALGGFRRANVWRTEDGGETWQRASAGLPRAPVWSLVQHPERPQTWVAGTEVVCMSPRTAGAAGEPSRPRLPWPLRTFRFCRGRRHSSWGPLGVGCGPSASSLPLSPSVAPGVGNT